jgi:tRNA uridine 5-carbamoylmethylation protein Kti12
MLVNFVGAPCSGKTTVAAGVFSELKNSQHNVEFITEKAREYIARKWYLFRDAKLDDTDQYRIMLEQSDAQRYMNRMDTAVICDSDPLLSMLYMSTDFRKALSVVSLAKEVYHQMGLVFYCPMLDSYKMEGNRIHDLPFAIGIDKQIRQHYLQYAPKAEFVELPQGSVADKVGFAISHLNDRL